MDAKIRELQRRWQTTGDPEAELQYLVARLRTGDLSWGAIECAAYLGDEVCRGLLGEDGLGFLPKSSGVEFFFNDLPRPDGEVLMRAGFCVIRHLEPHLAQWKCQVREALHAATQWVECPCDEHDEQAKLAAEGLLAACPEIQGSVYQDGRPVTMLHTIWSFLRHAVDKDPNIVLGVRPVEVWDDKAQESIRRDLVGALVPWVLTRSIRPAWREFKPLRDGRGSLSEHWHAVDERIETLRRARLAESPDPEELPIGRDMDAGLARGTLENLGSLADRKSLTNEQGGRVVTAYLLAAGWTSGGRGELESPSGRRRIRIQKAVLKILLRVRKGWEEKRTLVQRMVPLNGAGVLLLDRARRAADQIAATTSPAPRRSFGPAPVSRNGGASVKKKKQ
jgi:hypothetical protein